MVLGRVVRLCQYGIEYEADLKHRDLLLQGFGFEEGKTKALNYNGEKDWREEEDWELEEVGRDEAT